MLSATTTTDAGAMDIDLTERKDVFAWIIGLGFLALLASFPSQKQCRNGC